MMKYVDVKEVFAEIPDEITLAISISGCPIHCPGCHSQYLWTDIGEPLTEEALAEMLKNGDIIKISGGRYTSYTWNWEKE